MSKRLNVLIGCEESGVVREAFRALGHNAYSCDLQPSRDGSQYHLIGDARVIARGGVPQRYAAGYGWQWRANYTEYWDLGIFHPPCTYLCNSGVRWFTTIPKIQKPGVLFGEARRAALVEGASLVADLLTCGIPKIAIENPQMHKHARAEIAAQLHGRGVSKSLGEFDQWIQPWEFGDPAFKRTGLILEGLDPLVINPAQCLEPPSYGTEEYKRWSSIHRASPGPNRARDRSVTYKGIAAAMALQWGGDVRS